jgi:hypothetical protein
MMAKSRHRPANRLAPFFMSYEFYKILHLAGLVALFASLGALAVVPADRRKPFMAVHGTATLIMLVAGFGLLARLGLNFGGNSTSNIHWVYGKIVIWLLLGAVPVVLKRKPNLASTMLGVSILLGVLAALLAILKPGA